MIKCTSCDAEVNYAEAILRDVLYHEIQLDLLGDKNQDMTLEQVFQFVEAKEAGKRSASPLLTPHGANALASSSYRCRGTRHLRDVTRANLPAQKAQGRGINMRYAPTAGERDTGGVPQPEGVPGLWPDLQALQP